MKRTERLEMEINSSRLFSMEKGTSEYRAEAYRMVELLSEYYFAIGNGKYKEYGLELVETANKCISSYCPDNGIFLHYFNKAMAKAYRAACGKAQNEMARGGIHISEIDDKALNSIRKYMNTKGIDTLGEEQYELIAESLGMTVERIEELLLMSHETSVVSSMTTNEDGETVDLLDLMADPEFDDLAQHGELVREILLAINEEYASCQERSKPIISAYLTVALRNEFEKLELNLGTCEFIDQRIIDEYSSTGRFPTQREIAAGFGKNEASISRTIHNFLDKLKEKIKNYNI